MRSESLRALPKLRGNFVFLRADELRLLLPQVQVGAATYLDARPQAEGGSLPGLMRVDGDPRVVAALSSRMTLLPECPPGRFVVTSLVADGNFFNGEEEVAWCWDELKVLIDIELNPLPLPAALAAPATPVDCFVEHQGELVFLCDANRLQAHALGQGAST